MTNAEFAASDREFIEACRMAGIPPSKREASKYRNKQGLAWWMRNGRAIDNRQDLGIQISQE